MNNHYLNNEELLALMNECERDLQAPPRDFTAGIMQKIAVSDREKQREIRSRRRMFAVASFASAAAIMLMSGLGIFQNILTALPVHTETMFNFIHTIFK